MHMQRNKINIVSDFALVQRYLFLLLALLLLIVLLGLDTHAGGEEVGQLLEHLSGHLCV